MITESKMSQNVAVSIRHRMSYHDGHMIHAFAKTKAQIKASVYPYVIQSTNYYLNSNFQHSKFFFSSLVNLGFKILLFAMVIWRHITTFIFLNLTSVPANTLMAPWTAFGSPLVRACIRIGNKSGHASGQSQCAIADTA